MRTTSVATRTTLLLVRFRFHAEIPLASGGTRPLVVEDARLFGFTGAPEQAQWLDEAAVETLVTAKASGNVPPDVATSAAARVLDGLGHLTTHLDTVADDLAEAVLESHRRARSGAGAARRGLKVTAQKPPDILGAYVYLPLAGSSAGDGGA
jgi:hypothetical protein